MKKFLNIYSKYLSTIAKYKMDPILLSIAFYCYSHNPVKIVYTYLFLIIVIHIPLTILKAYNNELG